MTDNTTPIKKEPAAIVGTVTSVVSAVLVLLTVFGLELTLEQQATIIGVVAVLAPLVATLVTRGLVVSPATAAKRVATALALRDYDAQIAASGARRALREPVSPEQTHDLDARAQALGS